MRTISKIKSSRILHEYFIDHVNVITYNKRRITSSTTLGAFFTYLWVFVHEIAKNDPNSGYVCQLVEAVWQNTSVSAMFYVVNFTTS